MLKPTLKLNQIWNEIRYRTFSVFDIFLSQGRKDSRTCFLLLESRFSKLEIFLRIFLENLQFEKPSLSKGLGKS